MNDSNEKFRKNPFPWMALMTIWTVFVAAGSGWIGGCTRQGKAEEALKDDRLKAKISKEIAAEVEAKKTIELQKLREKEATLEKERASMRIKQDSLKHNRDSVIKARRAHADSVKALAQARRDSLRKVANKPRQKREYQFACKLIKVDDTGRSMLDIKGAKDDNWKRWWAEIYVTNSRNEFVTIKVAVGELTIVNDKSYKLCLVTDDVPNGRNLLAYSNQYLLNSQSGSYRQWDNHDHHKAQLVLHIPFDEVKYYVKLCHYYEP